MGARGQSLNPFAQESLLKILRKKFIYCDSMVVEASSLSYKRSDCLRTPGGSQEDKRWSVNTRVVLSGEDALPGDDILKKPHRGSGITYRSSSVAFAL